MNAENRISFGNSTPPHTMLSLAKVDGNTDNLHSVGLGRKPPPTIIDLTQDDDSEPESTRKRSLKMPRRQTDTPSSSKEPKRENMLISRVKKIAKRKSRMTDEDDDPASLALAQRLQDEWNRQDHSDQYSLINNYPTPQPTTSASPLGGLIVRNDSYDEASLDLAARLQAQFDAEASTAFAVTNETSSDNEPSSFEQRATELQQYTANLSSVKCFNCRSSLWLPNAAEANLTQMWFTSRVICNKCGEGSCLGCGSLYPISHPSADKGVVHCDAGRLLTVWIALCRFDMARKSASSKPMFAQHSLVGKSLRGNGNALSGRSIPQSNRAQGTGYGAQRGLPLNYDSAPTPANVQDDNATVETISVILDTLPCVERVAMFDLQPPEILCAMLQCSSFLDKIAELLRNDALEDIVKRQALYHQVLHLVQALCGHFALARLVHQPRFEKPEDVNFLMTCTGSKNRKRGGKSNANETNSSIASCASGLILQSKTILAKAKADEKEFLTDEGQDMLLFCARLADIEQLFAMSVPHDCAAAPSPVESEEVWHRKNCMLECEDEVILKEHVHAADARAVVSPPFGRMKRLIGESATLQTSLPPGIFVRYGSSRLDVLKVLMVGPENTPYANGLFEFDVLCPLKYPQDPPKVHFKTTGQGRAHFNPNLYQNGYVCLSLINTWSGERWSPGKSTLLQVLVSIQSMIFCDEPWYNEPGREQYSSGNGRGNPESAKYNQTIQSLTVRHAMLDWQTHNGIWTDVVNQHFRRKGDAIMASVNTWASTNLQISKSVVNDLAKLVRKMKQ